MNSGVLMFVLAKQKIDIKINILDHIELVHLYKKKCADAFSLQDATGSIQVIFSRSEDPSSTAGTR